MPSNSRDKATQYAKQYRQRKIDKGLCTYGGCWHPTGGRRYCDEHSNLHLLWHRIKYTRRTWKARIEPLIRDLVLDGYPLEDILQEVTNQYHSKRDQGG